MWNQYKVKNKKITCLLNKDRGIKAITTLMLNRNFSVSSKVNNKARNIKKIEIYRRNSACLEKKVVNNDLIYKSLNPSLLSAKEFPNASKQWINSVYSFNSNYIKNIASADNTLNKILKIFFNLNPFPNNVNGKKSKLIKRRFRRLSLNKLFLSKSEIKHNNDKVHVTVYLFNKKKRSLIYKINKLFSSLRFEAYNDNNRFKTRGMKFKQFNSKSLNPGGKNTRNWIKSKRSLFTLNKLNSINKKYHGITLKYLNNIRNKKILKIKKNLDNLSFYSLCTFYLGAYTLKRLARNYKDLTKNISSLGKLPSKKVKLELHSKYRVRSLKRKVLFKSYKKLYENLGLITKRRKQFKTWDKKKRLPFTYRNNSNKPSFMQTSKNNFNNFNKPRFVQLTRNKFNIPRFMQVSKAKSLLIQTGNVKKKNILLKNIDKINSNYIKHLEIKQRKSCLTLINKKTKILTSSKFRAHSFYRRKFRRNAFSKLYYEKKIQNYKNLNNVTKNSIYKFFTNILIALKGQKLYDKKTNVLNTSLINTADLKSLNKYNALPIVKNYYNNFNKYKLYKLSIAQRKKPILFNSKHNTYASVYDSKTFKTSLNRVNLFKTNSMPSLSMHKLKELYKLFTFYNNKRNLHLTDKHVSSELLNKSLLPSLSLNAMSSKLLINTSKLLKKVFAIVVRRKGKLLSKASQSEDKNIMQAFPPVNKESKRALAQALSKYKLNKKYNYFTVKKSLKLLIKDKKLSKAGKSVKNLYLKTLITSKRFINKNKINNSVYIDMVNNARNVRIFKYFNKIDRFITRYLKNYLGITSNNLHNKKDLIDLPCHANNSLESSAKKEIALNISHSHLRNIYKLNLVKLLFENESIYLNYIKLLSFNNAIFKNWFLHNLKNMISKIYNKNVILNVVNLKYIHLNSDILVQAIKIKLNKFRKNRVKRVLKLIINKIKVKNVNKEFFNLNHDQYKNVLLHYNNYNTLNTEVFFDLNTNSACVENNNQLYYTNKNTNNLGVHKKNLSYYKIPSKLKALNAIQYNTINFTKYKSVTGVRVQAAGRLTKRSTAARSVLSLRYAGSLRNNNLINNNSPSILLKGSISNLQFTRISSKTRNGSFGVKGWISSN